MIHPIRFSGLSAWDKNHSSYNRFTDQVTRLPPVFKPLSTYFKAIPTKPDMDFKPMPYGFLPEDRYNMEERGRDEGALPRYFGALNRQTRRDIMHELKLSGGRIRMYKGSLKLIHSIAKKKRHSMDDITLLFKDIRHVELYKPRWPFTSGYIRFSLDGSCHAKKNIRAAERESFSMLCHSMQEYKRLKRVKRFVETELEILHVS